MLRRNWRNLIPNCTDRSAWSPKWFDIIFCSCDYALDDSLYTVVRWARVKFISCYERMIWGFSISSHTNELFIIIIIIIIIIIEAGFLQKHAQIKHKYRCMS